MVGAFDVESSEHAETQNEATRTKSEEARISSVHYKDFPGLSLSSNDVIGAEHRSDISERNVL